MIRHVRVTGMAHVATMVLLFLFSGAGAVSAQDVGPCTETLKKFCSDVTPGGKRLIECVREHEEEVPTACLDWIDDLMAKAQELNEPCFEEILNYCNFDEPDPLRIIRCLEKHYIQLRLECRQKLREVRNR